MEYKRDSSFLVGKHASSCGKEEALERAMEQLKEQHLDVLTIDVKKEEGALSGLLHNE